MTDYDFDLEVKEENEDDLNHLKTEPESDDDENCEFEINLEKHYKASNDEWVDKIKMAIGINMEPSSHLTEIKMEPECDLTEIKMEPDCHLTEMKLEPDTNLTLDDQQISIEEKRLKPGNSSATNSVPEPKKCMKTEKKVEPECDLTEMKLEPDTNLTLDDQQISIEEKRLKPGNSSATNSVPEPKKCMKTEKKPQSVLKPFNRKHNFKKMSPKRRHFVNRQRFNRFRKGNNQPRPFPFAAPFLNIDHNAFRLLLIILLSKLSVQNDEQLLTQICSLDLRRFQTYVTILEALKLLLGQNVNNYVPRFL
ncbi:uncharacterized protein LOC123008813 [Tribolium madens]|uniref:uncharacterized protein LOC123008813 n=1 Tax=Tribolium madens TaxID=41895 RepID=UPI001CF7309A|nr:uncharacterized protein LOC123008813 [Tribolium madens]